MIIKKASIITLVLVLFMLLGCSDVDVVKKNLSKEDEYSEISVVIPDDDQIDNYQKVFNDICQLLDDGRTKQIMEKMQFGTVQISILNVQDHYATIELLNKEVLSYERRGLEDIKNGAIFVANEREYVRLKDVQFKSLNSSKIKVSSITVLIELDKDKRAKVPYHFYVFNREREMKTIFSHVVKYSNWDNEYFEIVLDAE